MNIIDKIQKSKKAILGKSAFKPSLAVIAGSGVGNLKDNFTVLKTVKYCDAPYFAKTTVSGHAGEINFCSYKGTDFLIFNGRFHFYEGHSASDVIYPVRVMKAAGIETLVITAAGGGINKNYIPADIIVLSDHINFTGNNPLIGVHYKEFGERFPNMGGVYDKLLRKKALASAKKYRIRAREGVYFGVSGPAYETPAAVRAYRTLGADIVGMSVVYEAMAAAQMKMKILGLAYVSNMAAGLNKKSLSHEEVLETGKTVSKNIAKIIQDMIRS
ncbi:MAG: purine-nucleoside phosphorylase [Endomicrobium sp.]|jgi:purine-nucleoside phosphorylase|nr:purine-nucleoside phosphorylase [Endomicrobium sp.]